MRTCLKTAAWPTQPSPSGLQVAETMLGAAGALDLSKTDGPTGYWGLRTEDATKKFQKQNGLKVDGLMNPGGETIRTLAKVAGNALKGFVKNNTVTPASLSPDAGERLGEGALKSHPVLTAEQSAENARTVAALGKIKGVGDLPRFTSDAINTHGDKAIPLVDAAPGAGTGVSGPAPDAGDKDSSSGGTSNEARPSVPASSIAGPRNGITKTAMRRMHRCRRLSMRPKEWDSRDTRNPKTHFIRTGMLSLKKNTGTPMAEKSCSMGRPAKWLAIQNYGVRIIIIRPHHLGRICRMPISQLGEMMKILVMLVVALGGVHIANAVFLNMHAANIHDYVPFPDATSPYRWIAAFAALAPVVAAVVILSSAFVNLMKKRWRDTLAALSLLVIVFAAIAVGYIISPVK